MEMQRKSVNFEGLRNDISLSDICSKTNRKVSYICTGTDLTIAACEINSWSFVEHLNSIIKDIFLPKGYPESVSSDYLEYQIWDTCQAFCSSISGTLAMRAVMQGIGVGSEAATPVSAAVTWLFKDGTGIIGGILFAWLKGSKLDSDCKKWRLFADFLNDLAMLLELYIPSMMEYSLQILCISTVLKALVGTAGNSTRAALIAHQAVKGNTADVSAKDGSQETFTNLCAFVFGIFLLKNVTETRLIWNIMYTATFFHLFFNYKAVRCLKINIFNSQRFHIALDTYLATSIVPTVEQINKKEPVFLLVGTSDFRICGFSISFGSCMKKAITTPEIIPDVFSAIFGLFEHKHYVILPNLKERKLYVSFQNNFPEISAVKAYFHACLLGLALSYVQGKRDLKIFKKCRKHSPLSRVRNFLNEPFDVDLDREVDDEITHKIMQAYIVCDVVLEKEFAAFCDTCDEEGWILNKHLFNIGDWRAEWKPTGRKRLSFRLGHQRHGTSRSSTRSSRRSSSRQLPVLMIA